MNLSRLLGVCVLSLSALLSLPSQAAPKTQFNVCWTIYALCRMDAVGLHRHAGHYR